MLKEKLQWHVVRLVGLRVLAAVLAALVTAGLIAPELLHEIGQVVVGAARPSGL